MPGLNDPAWLASAAGFAAAMAATPGPNNALATASGAAFGLRRTLPFVLGVALGFPAMLLAMALGAAEALHAWPGAQRALRWVGAGWLLWLAWRVGTAPVSGEAGSPATATTTARPMSFVGAALFQWVNPKAWIIAAGPVAAYTGADVAAEAGVLAAPFAAASFASVLAWAAAGAGAGRVLRRPAALRAMNRAMGVLLAASVLPVLLD